MGLRPGYKQTELGVIPEDWIVLALAELFAFQNGFNAEKSAYGSGTPFINVLEVITCPRLTEDRIPGRVSLSTRASGTFEVQHGDTLFNRTSETQEDVGLAAVYIGDTPVVFGGFVIRAKPRNKRLDSIFASYALRSPAIRAQIISRGQGAVRANIGQQELSKVEIFVPAKHEQEAIAEALSDADALIESLEQLIGKKRQIMQGAMQELLTGKKRLPGFSGEWVTWALAEIASAKKGMQLGSSETSEHDGFPHLNGGVAPSGYSGKSNAPGGTIAISEGGNSCGYVQYMAEPFWCGGHCYAVEPKRVEKRFLYYALKASEASIMDLRVGSGLPNVQKTALLAFKLRVPVATEEQTAIATILSDMDTELAELETKLSKARQLKRGMMQALLTGAIRLPVAEGV